MAEQKNRWSWEVPGFEPMKSFEQEQQKQSLPLRRRYSISTSSLLQELPKQGLAVKVPKLKDKVKHAKEDFLELRQEACDLQEYSNAKLVRVTRYLGVLASRARQLEFNNILPNGCLVVKFPGRDACTIFLADPAEVEPMKFGLFTAMKFGLFVGKSIGRSKKKKGQVFSVQGDRQHHDGQTSGKWLQGTVTNILFCIDA